MGRTLTILCRLSNNPCVQSSTQAHFLWYLISPNLSLLGAVQGELVCLPLISLPPLLCKVTYHSVSCLYIYIYIDLGSQVSSHFFEDGVYILTFVLTFWRRP